MQRQTGLWEEVLSDLYRGAKRGAREALVGVWTPLRLRFWRYVACEARKGPWAAFLSFSNGYDLTLEGRLDRRGRVRR